MSNNSFTFDRNDISLQPKISIASNEMSQQNKSSTKENRITRSQSNRPLNLEANNSLDLQNQEPQATLPQQPHESQNIGTARHYKISNETKFQIFGQHLGKHNFEAEKIIDQRVSKEGIHQYLVKWKGQKLNLCQWLSNIDPSLVEKYLNQIKNGKTQPGKGAYAFKRALRRDTKMNVPAGFVITTNSNVLNSQKLRISTNGSHPKVISSALRKGNVGVEKDGFGGDDYDNVDFGEYADEVEEEDDEEDNDYDILKYRNKRTMKKNNKFYSRRKKGNFQDEFDYEDFQGQSISADEDENYEASVNDVFSRSLNKRSYIVPTNRAKQMADIISSRPSPFQQQEDSASSFIPNLRAQNQEEPKQQEKFQLQYFSTEKMFKPKPVKLFQKSQSCPKISPKGFIIGDHRKSNTFKPVEQKEFLAKRSRSIGPSSTSTPNIYDFPYFPCMQQLSRQQQQQQQQQQFTRMTPTCQSSFFEISPPVIRKEKDSIQQLRFKSLMIPYYGKQQSLLNGEINFCQGSFGRGDQPKSIERIYINQQNEKVVKVNWLPRREINGKQFQPNPTQYAWKSFPEAGFKLVLDYLLDKFIFNGTTDRVVKNNDLVSTKAQSDRV